MFSDLEPPGGLAPQFLKPEGWVWSRQIFKNKTVRWGSVIPESPSAIVVCLPGLGEFCEKYFEFAHEVLAQGMGLAVVDWPGQGLSTRYVKDHPRRRHAEAFDDYAALLESLVGPLKEAHPDVPLIMMAHSMGGAIGLLALRNYPKLFAGAFFSAPMAGMRATSFLPQFISLPVINFFHHHMPESYAFGQQDWPESSSRRLGQQLLSSDEERGLVHDLWCQAHPELRVGGVTWGWLNQAYHACMSFEVRPLVDIPVVCTLASREVLVDNDAAKRVFGKMPGAEVFTIDGAFHEILMERDDLRNQVLEKFFALADQVIKNDKNA